MWFVAHDVLSTLQFKQNITRIEIIYTTDDIKIRETNNVLQTFEEK